jgi:hypothetical protein
MDVVSAAVVVNPAAPGFRLANRNAFATQQWVLGAIALAILCAGCGPPPMAGGRPAANELGLAVLEAFERQDVEQLESLALSEREFREHVWPALPAARPERNLPFSYVWGDLRQKSHQSLSRLLAASLPPVDLVRVEFAGGTTRYATYAVHRETVLVVRDRDGVEQRLRLYGATLEKDGTFKVFSFVVDD